MPEFNQNDVTNEVSEIFRGELQPRHNGNVVDTIETHRQVMEVASTSFMLNPESVFRVSKLAANKTLSLIDQERNLLEDMLVAIQYVGRTEKVPTDTTSLNNARTALLSLDASRSIQNRPELRVFSKNMLAFANSMASGVVLPDGTMEMTGEEAKNSLREDFGKLEAVHDSILAILRNISSLYENYTAEDIQTRVSKTAFRNVRAGQEKILNLLKNGNQPDLEKKRRSMLLKSLVGNSMVDLVANATPPEEMKYRGPSKPYPSNTPYSGRSAGTGTAASLLTSPGPWVLPMENLVLRVDGGSTQIVPLSSMIGATLVSRGVEPFVFPADNTDIYMAVDPNTQGPFVIPVGFLAQCTTTRLVTSYPTPENPAQLGYKHLASPVFFGKDFYDNAVPDADKWKNLYPAYITDFALLATYTSASWNAGLSRLTVTGLTKAMGGAASFDSRDVGRYIKDNFGVRFEITAVISANVVELDPHSSTPGIGAGELRGVEAPGPQRTTNWSTTVTIVDFTFNAALTSTPFAHPEWVNKPITFGPAVKTGRITAGSYTTADAAAGLMAGASCDPANYYAKLGYHVTVAPDIRNPLRLAFKAKSKVNSKLVVQTAFTDVAYGSTRQPLSVDASSAHAAVGLYVGETDSGSLLTPNELVELIRAHTMGIAAEVQEDEILSGTGNTDAGQSWLYDPDVDFIAAGVTTDYQVELKSGVKAGVYSVVSAIDSHKILLDGVSFDIREDVNYRVFTEKVKISSASDSHGSALKVDSGPAALGLSTDEVYGELSEFEAVDSNGSPLSFDNVFVNDLIYTNGKLYTILSVGTTLGLDSTIPTNAENLQFEITSAGYVNYQALKTALDEMLSSKLYLKKHNFDQNLDALDQALSPVLASGSGLAAFSGKVRTMLHDLLATMCNSVSRTNEHGYALPESQNVERLLLDYEAPTVDAVDIVVDGLQDHNYDRAADLLTSGDIKGFYQTDNETASYAGAVLSSSRTSAQDFQDPSNVPANLGGLANSAENETEHPDNYDELEEADLMIDEELIEG